MTTATATSPLEALRALAAEGIARDSWSREQLLEHQGERLRGLLAHAVGASAYYREALGPDAAERPLANLPTLPKASRHRRPGRRAYVQAHLRRAAGGDAPRLSVLDPLDEVVAALNAYQPEALLGYPSFGALLAAEQLAGRLRIAPRIIAFGSEPLTGDMRAAAHAAWGIEPAEYYASTEVPLIASSSLEHPRALEVFEDMIVLEVVDQDNRPVPPATTGAKVLLTNLVNRVLPLIRYELSDGGRLSAEPNPAGRPFTVLSGIDGRSADVLRLPGRTGGEVAVMPLRFGSLFAGLPEVRQFQVVLGGGALGLRVVLASDAPRDIRERIAAGVRAELEDAGALPPPVEVEPVAALEREAGPAGKLKLVIDAPRAAVTAS